jgi:hypothetical protein
MPLYDEYRAAKRKRRLQRMVFDVPTARRMLPLLRRITADVVEQQARLAHYELLDRRLGRCHGNAWSKRQTRYWLQDELTRERTALRQTLAELTRLGTVLLDGVHGVVGFPTIVNGSLAYLVFRTEDDDVRYWRYRDQAKLRPIPENWGAIWRQQPLDRSPVH